MSKLKRQILVSFLIALTLLVIPIKSQSCKMSGMQYNAFHSNLGSFSAKGTGRNSNNILSISWREGQGALWNINPVVIHPRFELRTRVVINRKGCGDQLSPYIDGFTIILSKTKDYLGPGGGALGYSGIYDALVTEIDLFQNPGDISSNSVSIHRCYKDRCSWEEGSNTFQANLPFAYDRCREMVYDVYMQFRDGLLSVFVNDLHIISSNENLLDKFDGFAYFGFSGSFWGFQRELLITPGSYWCVDQIQDVYFDLKFSNMITYGNRIPINIIAGAPIEVIAKFSDVEGLFIPHLYGQNVTSWKLTIGYNCGLSVYNWRSFIYIDKIQIQNLFYDCTKAGQFYLFFSLNGGPNKDYYGGIVSRGYEMMRILGSNGVVMDSSKIFREVNGQRYLNWGLIDGDFTVDQFQTLNIDLFPSDSFGNYQNIGDNNSSSLVNDSLIRVTRNGSFESFTFRKKTDNNYEFTLKISNPGEYRIENVKFPGSLPYLVRVFPGNISPFRSSCDIINDLSRGVIDNKVTVTYFCYLLDIYWNPVDIPMLEKYGQLTRYCTVWRGNDVNSYVKLFDINSFTSSTQNTFSCSFQTQGNGNYRIHSYFKMGNSNFENSTQFVQMRTSMNEFKVVSTPQNFTSSKIYDFTQNKFINVGAEEVNNITFTPDNNVPLTLISLADESGTESANIGYGPNFSLADFSGSLTNSHAPTIRPVTALKFELYTLPANGKQYVAVSFANQNSVLIRNSFHYLLALKYKFSNMNIRMFYPVLFSNGQTVCLHDLKVENTLFIKKDLASQNIKNNDYVMIGSLVLRTTDNNLFNKFIQSSRITYALTPSVPTTKVIISEDPTVAGFYAVYVQGVIVNDYKLNVLVDTFVAVNDYSFSILPVSTIHTMQVSADNKYKDSTNSPTTGQTLIDTTADDAQIMLFTGADLFKNNLKILPNSANNFLGVSLEINVGDKRIVERIDSSAVKFIYNGTAYQIEDNSKTPGNYLIKITSAQGKILFNYYKRPGLASNANSFAVLNSPNKIKLSETIVVGLNLRDKSNNLINFDTNLLTSELSKIKIYALHEDNVSRVNLTLNPNPGAMPIFSANIVEKAGKYSIKVEYTSAPSASVTNLNCNSCIFEANYEQFDINKCKLYIVTSKNELLTQDGITNINNVNDIPLFNFLFFDTTGKQLNLVDNKSNLKAFITGANNFRLDLNRDWIKSYQILWTMPEDNVSEDKKFKNLKGDNYILNISYNEAIAHKYTLKLLGDGKDEDAGNGAADISKTHLNEANISAIAGVTYSTNIEFRTVDNLRVNYYDDLVNFSFKNSANLDNKRFNVLPQKGPKKGTYILAIYSEVAFLPSAPLLLTLAFKGVEIPQKIRIEVKHSDLASIEVLPESIKNSAELTLRDCSVDNENLFYLQAFDKFKNIFLDIYETTIYSVNRIKSLFDVQHADKFQITLNAGTSFQKDKFFISVIARNKGLVTFTSTFLANKLWKISFSPGAFDASVSYGVVSPSKLISGENISFNVFLRDKYNNEINVATASAVYAGTQVFFKRNNLSGDKPLNKSLDTTKNAFAFGFAALLKGTYNFLPTFADTAIRCDNCQAIVSNAKYVFGKSALFYISSSSPSASTGSTTNQRLNANEAFELSKTILPTFGLNLFDVNNNIYDLIPEDFALGAQLLLPSGQLAVDLCTEKNNEFLNIFICRDPKSRSNWKFLLNGPYTLKIEDKSLKADTKDKFITYNINVVNGAVDPNASNGEVDISKTVFSVAELRTVAGESGQFMVEIRTVENKRKYAWEDEPAKYILISFAKNVENNYTFDVNLGEMPGQYIVKLSSKKAFTALENNFISFKINGIDLLNRVKLVTVPNAASYSNFVDASGAKITTLPSGFADDVYELKMRIFDKHDNLITPKLSDINFNVVPPAEKSNVSIISNLNINQDSSVSVYISAIFAGSYTLKSTLFADCQFAISPGNPSSNNSLAIAETEVVAGSDVKLIVIPYDKNNNLIAPRSIRTKETFIASFKYKIKEDFIAYINLANAVIEKVEYPKGSKTFLDAFSFTQQLKFKGQNFFKVLYAGAEIKCVNCITNVLPAEPLFNFFLFQYFDSTKGQFSELVDNTSFDNSKTEPIIRLYPRDRFQNLISVIKNFDRYTLSFTEKKNTRIIYKFKVSNIDDGKQEYIEFKQNDEFSVNKDLFFKTLTKGEYILTISEDSSLNKTINTFLLGTDSDSDASNDDLDISKTVITDSNLEFTAGLDGRLIIELRTVTNMRKNNWFYKVDVQPRLEDKSFTKKVINATKLGQYLITFGSTKANTFPTYFDYGLKITIDGKEVIGLNPLVKINPDIMAKSFIVDSFLKAPGAKEIVDGNSDKNLEFSIQAKDQFDNITRVNTELLKLSITGPDGNLVIYTSDGQYSASLGFTADTRKAGTYSLIGNTLPSYTYRSSPGALNFDNSIVYNANTKIVAGQTAAVVVVPKDKNSNVIDPIKVIELMRVTVRTPNKNLELVSVGSGDGNKINFSLKLEEKGINKWTVLIDKKLKACESCFVEVIPDAPSADKSLVFLLDEVNNSKINYANNSEIRVSNKFPINIFISLRDKFENLIDSISGNSSVLNPVFTGLDINPINLSILRTTDNSQFWLRVPQESHRLFNHLISGRNYSLNFSVKDEVNSQAFNYPINILSDREDSESGNGDYVIENTYISDTLIDLYADNKKTFVMRLKTAKKLFYNDDIDIENDIKYSVEPSDETFQFTVSRDFTKYNYYTLSVFSRKSLIDTKLALTISLRDPANKTVFKPIPQKVNLLIKPKMPPFAPKTVIISLPKENENLSPMQPITITFNLFDEYGNIYNKNTEVLKFLSFINNEKQVDKEKEKVLFQLKNDGITYEATFTPLYPPKVVNFFINYLDTENKIMLNILDKKIKLNIISVPDYKFTRVSGDNINIMKAGEKPNLYVNFYDKYDACVEVENEITIVGKIRGPLNTSDLSLQKTLTYNFKKNEITNNLASECKSNFIMEVPKEGIYTIAGEYEISIFVGSQQYKLTPIIQKLIPGDLDVRKTISKYTEEFSLRNNKFKAGENFAFVLIGFDKFLNPITSSLKNFSVKLINKTSTAALKQDVDFNLRLQDEKIGQLHGYVRIMKSGIYSFEYYYNSDLVELNSNNGPKEISVLPNVCSNKKSENVGIKKVDTTKLDKAVAGEPTSFNVFCYDEYDNKINTGGEVFIAKIQLKIENGKTTEVNSKVTDNQDGSYKFDFTPPLKGKYDITILLNKEEFINIADKEIGDLSCPKETPFRCTNNVEKCVKDLKECLPVNPDIKCDSVDKPIGCAVNKVLICVKSRTECDCPENPTNKADPYVRCESSKTCVLKSKFDSMCFDPLLIDCPRKFPSYPIFNDDGICRLKDENPSQRVCPLGFLLCPDLTCRQSIFECEIYDNCKNDEIRCSDMTCVKDQKDCPSTITCPLPGQYVCPDGECVLSELACKRLPLCNKAYPFLCSQNVCSDNKNNCPKSIACGHGKALCGDMICRSSCRN